MIYRVLGNSWEILVLQFLRGVILEVQVDQSVLHVAEDAHRGIDLGQLLDHQDGREKGSTRATILWVDSDAHELLSIAQNN